VKFSFGQSERERIEVDVMSYERPASGEYHDDNWLTVSIAVRVGAFSGRVGAAIVTDELVRFAQQLHRVYEQLSGSAEFTTLEGQLSLALACDTLGHITLRGEVLDEAGIGNRLQFRLDLDQSFLQHSIQELDAVIKAFPVRTPRPNQAMQRTAARSDA
jgi:hypothetical protein